MPTLEKINIELTGIGKALWTKNLAVPMYQRSYAWESKHIQDLFSDLSTAIQNSEPEYFLGSIVTTRNDKERAEVVDGQQRLATCTIILAAIRDYFYNTNDLSRSNEITSTYLDRKDLLTLDVIPKLKLNEADNDFFLKRVISVPDSSDRTIEATKPSHSKIDNAARLAKEYIEGIARRSNPTQQLVKLVEYIRDSVRVIWVSVSDDSNAFTIFETLNDRGLSLAVSDLLKNYLFGIAADRQSEVQDHWLRTVSTLETLDIEEITVTFIRHWWSSSYDLVRERELYNDIKKRVRNKSQAIDFTSRMLNDARLYVAIMNTGHELWQEYGPTARQHMETLNLMKVVQIRPLLLSVFSKFTTEEVRKTLRLMVSWVVRFLIVGGLGGGTIESHYSQKARDIREGRITSAAQLARKLKEIVPTDSVFKNAFQNATVSKQYLARYYLRVLERQDRGEEGAELVPNENQEIVNLEHILPQNPSNTWTYVSADEQEALKNRLGNLALMRSRINTEAGNDSFAFKKSFYRESDYNLTSMLAENTIWDANTIAKRQKRLADLAVKAWPLQ